MKICTLICLIFIIVGCATTQETNQLRRTAMDTDQRLNQLRTEINEKLADLTKETENIRKQLLNLSTSFDGKGDEVKTVLGKLDEMQHQLDMYRTETRNEFNLLRKGGVPGAPGPSSLEPLPPVKDEAYEAPYKYAFESYKKGRYEDAIQKFTAFLGSYPKNPLVPNALFWLGESYTMCRDYDKAIVYYQELAEKYPKNEMAPKALLSQAKTFEAMKDKKSSMTILKKIKELFPKTEEAAIAERRLRNLNP
jgi:tol-pal system protein YbgF